MSSTESPSKYENLENMPLKEILKTINKEDQTVPLAVEKALPQIEKLAKVVIEKLKAGGRLFYIGAGTSGRLGIVDASECRPTFGVPSSLVVGLIAGGDAAITEAVEFAEDDKEQAWADLMQYALNSKDIVIGISASGTTPYVLGALESCRKKNITTGSICCNKEAPLSQIAHYSVEVVVGAEFISGSTRMKAGTAQKLILNMLSTAAMIQFGRVQGNKMIDMEITNYKLLDRGIKMLIQELGISEEKAKTLIKKYKTVREAIEQYKSNA